MYLHFCRLFSRSEFNMGPSLLFAASTIVRAAEGARMLQLSDLRRGGKVTEQVWISRFNRAVPACHLLCSRLNSRIASTAALIHAYIRSPSRRKPARAKTTRTIGVAISSRMPSWMMLRSDPRATPAKVPRMLSASAGGGVEMRVIGRRPPRDAAGIARRQAG